IFVVGKNSNNNAVTVLKNGWVGIGSTIPSAVDEPAGHWAMAKNIGYYFKDLVAWDDGLFNGNSDGQLPPALWGLPGLFADVRQHIPEKVGELGPSFYKTEKLKVAGAITASEFYFPDYVFEHYFDGKIKDEKVNYQFNSLNDVKWYIKNFKHL